MKASEINAILKPMGTLHGINLYQDEPSQLFHYVSVSKGEGKAAIAAINAAGGEAMFCPGCGSNYSDLIQIRR